VLKVVQPFRSDLELYVHLHILATDGAYLEDEEGAHFLEVGAANDREMLELCARLQEEMCPEALAAAIRARVGYRDRRPGFRRRP
jgi:hypothetical protein